MAASTFFTPKTYQGTGTDVISWAKSDASRVVYTIASILVPPAPSGPVVPTTGQIWPRGNLSLSMGGGAAPVPPAARATVAITTASLAAGATDTGAVDLGKGYRLYSILTSAPSRTRLYTTATKRTADASRPSGTDPTGDHGLILDFTSTASFLSADFSPLVDGFDGETTPDGLIPYSITNTGTSSAEITVTFTYLREEG